MLVQHPSRSLSVAVTLALGLTVGACGSSSNDNSGQATSGAQGAATGAVEQARTTVRKFAAAQPSIQLPALSKRPPAGKRFALMGCPLPVCKIETDGATAAAKALGWKVQLYTAPLTPEGYVQTWQQMLDDKPDVIAYLGLLPPAAIKKQLAAVAAAKIPTVVYASNGYGPADSGPPHAAFSAAPTFSTDGALMGATVVADAGEGAQAVFVNDPTFDYWTQAGRAFTKQVEGAAGSVAQLKVSAAGIGKTIPGAVVSYLQRHPKTEYVALAVNDFSVGLPAALAGAGLSGKVKVISRAPTAANMADIAAGRQWASVADENTAAGWRITDSLARLLVGDPVGSCCRFPDGWHQIFTKANAKPNVTPETPGVPNAFMTAWRLGS
jgi:hypothetical protein